MIPEIEEYKKLPIEELDARMEAAHEKLHEIWHTDDGKDYEAYKVKCKPYWDEYYYLDTAKTMILPKDKITLHESSNLDNECRMPIDYFIEMCKTGYVSNYDGSGCYATEKEVARGIDANPRAFYDGYVRKDFDYVCWYNK